MVTMHPDPVRRVALTKEGVPGSSDVAHEAALWLGEMGDSSAPTHYKKLFDIACDRLCWCPQSGYELFKGSEDLRQSAERGSFGLRYLSKHVLGATHVDVGRVFLHDWVDLRQRPLFACEPSVELPLTLTSSRKTAHETLSRLGSVENKRNESDPVRGVRLFRGLAHQRQVSDYFSKRWPSLYLPATNAHRYNEGAPDDFRMKIGGRIVRFDVKSPNVGGLYQLSKGERLHAVVYVLSDVTANDQPAYVGWCTPAQYQFGVLPSQALSRSSLATRLNCEVERIDYRAMCRMCGVEAPL